MNSQRRRVLRRRRALDRFRRSTFPLPGLSAKAANTHKPVARMGHRMREGEGMEERTTAGRQHVINKQRDNRE